MSEIAKCERCREYNAAAVDFRNQSTNAQNDYAALQARHNALKDAVSLFIITTQPVLGEDGHLWVTDHAICALAALVGEE